MDKVTATDMVVSIQTYTAYRPTLQAYGTAEPLPPAPLNLTGYLKPPSIRPDLVSTPTSGSPTLVPSGIGRLSGYA